MTDFLTIHPGPQEYICAEGVLASLPMRLHRIGITRILIVHGTISWKKAQPFLEPLLTSDINIEEYHFMGEASEEAIAAVSKRATETGAEAIIGLGGGKIQDTAKYAAYLSNSLPFIAIPTLASNCAPWTSVTVVYHPEGSMSGLEVLPVQAKMLLIEPALVINSPKEYFIAGMADTLAKWYESDVILSLPGNQMSPMLLMARRAAELCQNIILENGNKALADLEMGVISPEIVAVIETIISISGTVGGFGDYLARTTVAHEIHDAITVFPESHQFLHGHKVGYGILVQLAVENKWEEISKLKEFYFPLGIPTSLKEMGLDYLSDEQLMEIGQFAARSESPVGMHPYNITAKVIADGMRILEKTNN
ncbi:MULTISPECIES: iron-containing alcohol dehydrogenase family protein [unclassified Jeotgalibaca]|uniref:iron-containing alcohol dehydrogenase family protein n=1 Tax=unclassified Jeotgalibaca TaxID=2621505 RepID=UPI003FCF263D